MKIECCDGKKLTSSEQAAIDCINQNVNTVAEMSITDIADKAFVSPATVSRAIRKCGYESLMKLRYTISSPEQTQHNLAQVNKILGKSYDECIRTIDNIRITSVLQTAEYIRSAKRIFIVGRG